jgi:hypothetical protein
MDDLTMLCLFGVALLILFAVSAFMRRNRPAPPGTYDDPNIRSGGSIGGRPGEPGQRTYDDPNIRSGGSFGSGSGQEAARTYDDPDIRSGGSFGGDSSSRESMNLDNRIGRSSSPPPARPISRSSQGPTSDSPDRPATDDRDIKSGGSFGG